VIEFQISRYLSSHSIRTAAGCTDTFPCFHTRIHY